MGKQTKFQAPKPGQPPVPPVEETKQAPTPPITDGDKSPNPEETESTLPLIETVVDPAIQPSTDNPPVDPVTDQQPPVTPEKSTKEQEKEKEDFQDKVDDAILRKILEGLPRERFNTAALSGRFDGIVMPHQKYLLETYFGRDGIKYAQGMARIFAKYGSDETGYDKLVKLYEKINKK